MGFVAAAAGYFIYQGVKTRNAAMRGLARANALQRIEDGKQLLLSINDKAREITRGVRRVGGLARATVASGNLVMEGSPLMVLENIYQQGIRDQSALHRAGKFKLDKLKSETYMDFLRLEAEQKAGIYEGMAQGAGIAMGAM